MVFAIIKRKFKKLRARKIIGLTNASHQDIIGQAVESVTKKECYRCVNHVIQLLK